MTKKESATRTKMRKEVLKKLFGSGSSVGFVPMSFDGVHGGTTTCQRCRTHTSAANMARRAVRRAGATATATRQCRRNHGYSEFDLGIAKSFAHYKVLCKRFNIVGRTERQVLREKMRQLILRAPHGRSYTLSPELLSSYYKLLQRQRSRAQAQAGCDVDGSSSDGSSSASEGEGGESDGAEGRGVLPAGTPNCIHCAATCASGGPGSQGHPTGSPAPASFAMTPDKPR